MTRASSWALAALASFDSSLATQSVPIVLDNMDGRPVVEVQNAFEGSLMPCLADAYQGRYHRDWAENKGDAFFTWSFDPPESGCYEIEEYHPGKNYECSRYLAHNARLDVEYSTGRTRTFSINQAANPAQWNKIGSLMFFEGHRGGFTIRNSMNKQCDIEGSCFMVADAIRLTKIGDACMSPPHHSSPIILDNMDGRPVVEVQNAFEGSLMPCLADAYQGRYHRDWAENKGDAFFTWSFDPPESGCYEIEEYHPGKNYECSRYLAHNARLDVEYSKGRSRTFSINQAASPAQWNKIGSLMFFEGHRGGFTIRNSMEKQCDIEGSCFMVADAIRLTKIGDACMSPPPHGDTPSGARPSQHGQLLLGISFGPGDQGEEPDVRAQLLAHSGAIEAALQAHFAFDRVQIETIKVASGRRLQLRQLEASNSHLRNFEVTFVAYGAADSAPGSAEALVALLKGELANAGTALSIASVAIVWSGAAAASSEDPSSSSEEWALLAIVVGFVALLPLVGVSALICLRMRRARQADSQTTGAAPQGAVSKDLKQELGDSEKAGAATDELKKDADPEVASASTGDPADRQVDTLESGSSEGNSEVDIGRQPAPAGAATSGQEVDDQANATVV